MSLENHRKRRKCLKKLRFYDSIMVRRPDVEICIIVNVGWDIMTVAEIRAKIAEYEGMLDKAEAAELDFALDVDEAEREKLHQEDLQRIRGFLLHKR